MRLESTTSRTPTAGTAKPGLLAAKRWPRARDRRASAARESASRAVCGVGSSSSRSARGRAEFRKRRASKGFDHARVASSFRAAPRRRRVASCVGPRGLEPARSGALLVDRLSQRRGLAVPDLADERALAAGKRPRVLARARRRGNQLRRRRSEQDAWAFATNGAASKAAARPGRDGSRQRASVIARLPAVGANRGSPGRRREGRDPYARRRARRSPRERRRPLDDVEKLRTQGLPRRRLLRRRAVALGAE